MAAHVCVAALVMAMLGAQAASPLVSDFRSADSARRLEILREISRTRANLEISQFISLVREGLRDASADVREGALGVAIVRGMSAAWAGTSGPAMGPGPQPSPAPPMIPPEWKGDDIRIRAALWDVFMSTLKNDADDRVRHQALLAIGNIQMMTQRDEALRPLLPLLLDLYRHDRSDEIRAEVVKVFRLERNTTAEMRAVLRDALVDTNASVRHEAQGAITAQVLGAATKLPFDEARDTIVAALQHRDPGVRLGAVQALNIYGAPSAPHLAMLERLSSADPDAQVRTSSRLAIEAIQRALRGQ